MPKSDRKTAAAYMAEPMTENQENFLAFCLNAAADANLTPKTAAALEAFELGVKAAGLYGRYQLSKRESASEPVAVAVPEPAPVAVAAKPRRTRKAA